MRIGIDARIANYSAAGIARYARGLLGGLAEELLRSPRTGLQITALSAFRKRFPFPVPPPLQERRLLTPPHFSFERISLGAELAFSRYDVIHCMDFFAEHPDKFLGIYSVHDLFFIEDPRLVAPDSYTHYKKLLNRLPHAAHAICISQFSKEQLLQRGILEESKISVIYPGVDSLFLNAEDESHFLETASPRAEEHYFLFVGTIEPRKNLPRQARGYWRAAQKGGTDRFPKLLVVGRDGYQADSIKSEMQKEVPSSHLKIISDVGDSDLRTLYKNAFALLFVTKGEGFGFPIVEAMQMGTPVITSSNSASAEVAQDAALLSSADSEEEISDALLRLFQDTKLHQELIDKGRARARKFSWITAAQEVLAIYQRFGRQ